MTDIQTLTIEELAKRLDSRWRWAEEPYDGCEIVAVKRTRADRDYFGVVLLDPEGFTFTTSRHRTDRVELRYITVEEDPFIDL